jgi:phospholipase D1/2
VTSWASYKAFANHAEKFNKTPEDVGGPNTADPVKVVHGGPGTHGAGGGGSGGGNVEKGGNSEEQANTHGRESSNQTTGTASTTRSGDVTDGKPRDIPGGIGNNIHHGRTASMGGKSDKSGPKSTREGAKSPGIESTSSMGGGGSERGKASGPDDAWAEWEKEEMEELLGEIRGHLGESTVLPFRWE